MGALFRMAHSPPITSLSPHFYGLLVVRYSLRFPLRTFRARLTSKAISMRSISALLAYHYLEVPEAAYSIFKVRPAAAPAPFQSWAAAVTIVYRTFEQKFMDS